MKKKLFSVGSLIAYTIVLVASLLVTSCVDKETHLSQVVLKACGTCSTFPVCCNASSDPDGDGWGWENSASCIVNGSAAQKQQCSGGITNCTATAINPFAQVNGGTWQNVSTGTVAAGGSVTFGPQPASGGSWRWTGPNGFTSTVRQITISNVQTANAGSYVAFYTNTSACVSTLAFTITVSGGSTGGSGGFTVSGTQLKDANGNNFIIKGFSVPTAWFVSDVNNNIANIRSKTGANCLRIVVTTSSSDADWQTSVNNCIANKMIPMVELHNVTCSTDQSALNTMAQFWASKSAFLKSPNIAKYILINIANEWGDWFMANQNQSQWRDGYQTAITTIRNAGINTTLVIDAPGCGQDLRNGNTMKLYANGLQSFDPKHNLLFSVHMYCEWATGATSSVSTGLPSIKNAGIPIIVGEFGYQHDNGNGGVCDIPESTVISTCQSNGIGWLAWSWKGNGSPVQYLDLSTDWAGNSLSAWGNTVVNGANGTKTAATASVFN